jgi:RimJ/RimL family protein N-acetyltransferase
MFYQLDETDYEKVRPLFLPLGSQLSSLAVLDGINPGRCLVDDLAIPQTAFLFSPEGCYLAGNPHNQDFNSALNQAIFNQGTFSEDMQAFSFVLTSDDWVDSLVDIFSPRTPIVFPRRHYVCYGSVLDWRSYIPEGFIVSRITVQLLNRAKLRIPSHVYSWIRHNWGSTSWFLEHGFGFVTTHGDEVVSWSLADCVSGSCCEIGIHTVPGYRRRGLATVTAAATVDYALSHGFPMVGWHCNDENLGSIGTAEKVGFTKERDYTMYNLFLDEATHLAELGYRSFLAGNYHETTSCYEQVFAIQEDLPGYHYHLAARAYAALGEEHRALDHLAAAIAHGWHDISHTTRCKEFTELLQTTEWSALMARVGQKTPGNIEE